MKRKNIAVLVIFALVIISIIWGFLNLVFGNIKPEELKIEEGINYTDDYIEEFCLSQGYKESYVATHILAYCRKDKLLIELKIIRDPWTNRKINGIIIR